jgi:PAS domain S-box-containing protein
MTKKPTDEKLKQRVRELEDEVARLRQAEDALRKSEKEYRNLFDSLPDPVAIAQGDLSIKLNPAFTRLFGYSLQDIENSGAFGLVKNDEDKEIARNRIEMRLSGKKVTPEFHSVDLVSKEGKTIPCEIRGVRIQYNGQPASLVSFRDITERKNKEDLIHSLIHKLIKSQESERQLISCELHDSVAQDLSFLKITADMLLKYKSLTPGVRKQISEASDILQKTIMSVRDLSYDLRPPGLEKFGLVQTLYMYCKDFSEKTGIRADFHSAGIESLKLRYESMINLYRVVQEGLNNIRKHSQAKNALIRLVSSYPHIILRIEDDGKGFNLTESLAKASDEKRMGIQSMQERANLLQGRMRVESIPGKGTKIIIRISHKVNSTSTSFNNLLPP